MKCIKKYKQKSERLKSIGNISKHLPKTSGDKKCIVFRKFDMLCFLKHTFSDFAFGHYCLRDFNFKND